MPFSSMSPLRRNRRGRNRGRNRGGNRGRNRGNRDRAETVDHRRFFIIALVVLAYKHHTESVGRLEEKLRVSQEEHEEELRAEQQHKEDELDKKDKEVKNLHQRIQDKEISIQTLSRELDGEKKARGHERAICERKIEDVRSTCEKSGFGWLSFGAGLAVGATGGCVACAAGTMSFK